MRLIFELTIGNGETYILFLGAKESQYLAKLPSDKQIKNLSKKLPDREFLPRKK
jgi:serine kinase of HPr protein (carbohydrate metabolism regulator)